MKTLRLPRFLRTKQGIYRAYILAIVSAYSALFLYVFQVMGQRMSIAEEQAEKARQICQQAIEACADLRTLVEPMAEHFTSNTTSGIIRSNETPSPDSAETEPETGNIARDMYCESPTVLGVGQNGRYAYADVRYADGTVLRQYHRLPPQLRTK